VRGEEGETANFEVAVRAGVWKLSEDGGCRNKISQYLKENVDRTVTVHTVEILK
jgi:hypothetical protein